MTRDQTLCQLHASMIARVVSAPTATFIKEAAELNMALDYET